MKYATLKEDGYHILCCPEIAPRRPYNVEIDKCGQIQIGDVCYQTKHFDITDTEECRILKDSGGGVMLVGKVDTKEGLIKSAKNTPQPLAYLAQRVLSSAELLHLATGEANAHRLQFEMLRDLMIDVLAAGEIDDQHKAQMFEVINAGKRK